MPGWMIGIACGIVSGPSFPFLFWLGKDTVRGTENGWKARHILEIDWQKTEGKI